MNEGDAVLYPRVSWVAALRSFKIKQDEHYEVGVIIKKLSPDKSGEVIFSILCKNGEIKDYYDFELKCLHEKS
tara:strand:+ start:253 stop:471 length:219 start_codon:yes stop_codon:yes gene_type:complete